MTNDKILMDLIEAIRYAYVGDTKRAEKILDKCQEFLKSRNPEETKYSSVVSRAKKDKTK